MKKNTFRSIPNILAIAAGVLAVGMVFAYAAPAFAFNGPSSAPPNGTGAIGSDASNNVSIGTPTTISGTKLVVVGASNDNTTYGEQILANNKTPIFILRDDGSVSISTSTVSAGNTIIGGNLTIGGIFTASNLGASTISAGNVSAGQFGSNTGEGTYTFPKNIVIGFSYSTYTSDGLFGAAAFPSVVFTPSSAELLFGYSDAGSGEYVPRIGFLAPQGTGGGDQTATKASIGLEPSSGDMTFRGGTSNSEYMRITHSGDVGIGTTNPTTALTVVGNVSSTGICLNGVCNTTWPNNSQWISTGTALYYNGGNVGIGTSAPGAPLEVQSASGNIFLTNSSPLGLGVGNTIFFRSNWATGSTPSPVASISGAKATAQDGAAYGYLSFATFGALPTNGINERMRIDQNGNVGIGTTAPSQRLSVAGGNIYQSAYTGGTNYDIEQTLGNVNMYFWPSYGYGGTGSGGGGGWLDGTVWSQNWQGITGNTDNWDANLGALQSSAIKQARGFIDFYTESMGGHTIPSPRMTITNTGNVGIGTTAPGYTLDVNGSGNFTNPVYVGTAVAGGQAVNVNYLNTALASAVAGGVSGTTGYDAKFTGTNTIGNGNIFESGSNVGIGTTGPGNTLAVNGVIGAGGNYYNVLSYDLNNTPTYGIKIKTNIPYGSGQMPTIIIQGYDYGSAEPIGLTINWYTYGGSFIQDAVSSFGAYTPQIELSNEGGYVVIFLNDRSYYERFTVQAYENGLSGVPSWFNGWTAVDQAITGTNTVTVPYKNAFSGSVGIGTSAPAYTLDVNGVGNFNSNVIHNVGTPVAATDAATKNYVDTVVGAGSTNGNFATLTVTGNWNISGAAQGGLNMNGYNITGVNILGVTTIDPLYRIGGTDYETFAPSTVGVEEQASGEGTLAKSGSDYEYAINFSKLAQGSDLWVWYQAVDFSKDTVQAIATPYGQFANIYYTIDGSTLTFHGNAPAQFSFQLTGKRFDWQKWPTQAADQTRTPGFVLPVKD